MERGRKQNFIQAIPNSTRTVPVGTLQGETKKYTQDGSTFFFQRSNHIPWHRI